MCQEECDQGTPGQCTCAVYKKSMAASCHEVCGAAGMTCVRRHGDNAAFPICAAFDANTNLEPCGATGDADDVCVCGRASPQTPSACAPFTPFLQPNDEVCGGACVGAQCSCGIFKATIAAGASCTSVCAAMGAICTGRHSDGPSSNNRRCEYFRAGSFQEACAATGDPDDVCVCSVASSAPPPVAAPSAPPPNGPVFACAELAADVEPGDQVCGGECNGAAAGQCTCAIYKKSMAASCHEVCGAAGMTCVRRHGDNAAFPICAAFDANTNLEPCGATGDADDVCVCSKPASLGSRRERRAAPSLVETGTAYRVVALCTIGAAVVLVAVGSVLQRHLRRGKRTASGVGPADHVAEATETISLN